MWVNVFLRMFVKARPDRPINVTSLRQKVQRLTQRQPAMPAHVKYSQVVTQKMPHLCPAAWFTAHQTHCTVMYLHGGGYIFGNLETHRQICTYLSHAAQAQVLGVDYRLAPEHPYPAALDDALGWYRTLLQQVPAQHLILAGDSAGGGLVLACLQAAKQENLPMPAGVVLFSPWVDLTCSGDTYQTLADVDVMFHPDSLKQAAAMYLNGHPTTDPRASPLFGNFSGLPPMLIFASHHELLLSDAMRLHEKAIANGIGSTLHLEKHLPHVWPTMVILPEARKSLRMAANFISTLIRG